MIFPERLSLSWGAPPNEVPEYRIHEILHAWVNDGIPDEVLVDVADYRHVQQGPGWFVIGHRCNYQLRKLGRGWEFSCHEKRARPAKKNPLGACFEASIRALQVLESRFDFSLGFEPTRMRVGVRDRLREPWTEVASRELAWATRQTLAPLLLTVPRIEISTEESIPTIEVRWSAPTSFEQLLDRVSSASPGAQLQPDSDLDKASESNRSCHDLRRHVQL